MGMMNMMNILNATLRSFVSKTKTKPPLLLPLQPAVLLPLLDAFHQAPARNASQYDVKDRDELQGDFGFSFAVPIVKYEDGLSQSQLPSILDVLGEKVGLHGKDFAEKVAVKQLLLDFEDIMQENFAKPCKWTEENQRQDKWFSLLEKRTSLSVNPLFPAFPITCKKGN